MDFVSARTFTKRNILGALLISTVLLTFAANQMTMSFRSLSSSFQIQNSIKVELLYAGKENTKTETEMDKISDAGAVAGEAASRPEIDQLCSIPRLKPFAAESLRLIGEDEKEKELPKCLGKELVKFHPDHGSLVRVESPEFIEYWKTVNCCFLGFSEHGERRNRTKTECLPISGAVTQIPETYDYINVKCFKLDSNEVDYQDQFEFFRLKSKTSEQQQPPSDGQRAPSIILVGLDSISHANFIRSFPKSQELLQQLGAVEFFGHNKVSAGTQGNVMPMLTGCKLKKDSQDPEVPPGEQRCDLVWKKFQRKGYSVLRAEDDFGLPNTFFKQALKLSENETADYLWTDYLHELKYLNEAKGNQFTFGCFDYQWVQNLLFDRIYNVAEAFEDEGAPYFHFLWSATAAHDVIGYARFLDDPLHNLLTKLNQKWTRTRFLDNTIVVLMSDHGMAYGKYSRTNAGSIESRMPFLYFVFPEWFQQKYGTAVENMRVNTVRLTTPFDLHETLLDLGDLDTITNQAIESRSRAPNLSRNKGQSLFLPVPADRTCESANIPAEWCICWRKTNVESPETNNEVQQAVEVALEELNSRLSLFDKCAQLKLDGMEEARRLSSEHGDKSSFEIVFRTTPGGGLYEASVGVDVEDRKNVSKSKANDKAIKYHVQRELVRVNAYGKRGACLEEYENVPHFVDSACHCLEAQ